MRSKKGVLAAVLTVIAAALAAGCSSSGEAVGWAPSAGSGGAATGGAAGSNSATGGSATSAGSGGMPLAGGTAGASGNSTGGSTGAAGAGGSGPTSRPKIRTVGYLPNYRGALSTWATTLDFSLVSYVNVCFGTIGAAGDISYVDATLPTFVSAAHAAGAKVCLALGGATTNQDLGPIASQISSANRASFVQKITSYATSMNLDCIDIDFEGSGVNADYEGFVTALSASLKAQGKQTTGAVASWFGDQITANALSAFDFVNVMAYDLHNPGGSATPVQSSSLADAKVEVDYWVNRGLSKAKTVFGVPFYGYSWKPGDAMGTAVIYSDLLKTYGAAVANDEIMQNGVTVFLNSKATIQAKAQLAEQYGGIMSWDLGQDATGNDSLLRAIHDAL